jgi:uncharacterized membrane protein
VNPLYNASLFALLSILVNATPMVAGFAFALRPAATRLALVRALTLVGVFVTVANILSGSVNVLIYLARQSPAAPEPADQVYRSIAEILVIPFIGFVFLALAWVGVAIGLRKPFDH